MLQSHDCEATVNCKSGDIRHANSGMSQMYLLIVKTDGDDHDQERKEKRNQRDCRVSSGAESTRTFVAVACNAI